MFSYDTSGEMLIHSLCLILYPLMKRTIMKHHFSLTFKVNEQRSVDVQQVASDITGSDFHVEPGSLNGTEFSVHFVREGDHAADLLDVAREQVMKAVPSAELISMDMSDELPIMSMVDDITKIVIRACQLLGEAELAHTWLNQPQELLSGRVPKVLMADAEGRMQVSRVLAKLEAKN